MRLKFLALVFFLIETEATCQVLKRFESERDKIIVKLFDSRYNAKQKKKKFFIKFCNYVSTQTYSEFDSTIPYDRKFAYFFIELYHLGINEEAIKKKYPSNMIQQILLLKLFRIEKDFQ